MPDNRNRQFDAAVKAVVYPALGALAGFIPVLYMVPGLPQILLFVGFYFGAKSFSETLENAPEVRSLAVLLYVLLLGAFYVGFCLILSMILHLVWSW